MKRAAIHIAFLTLLSMGATSVTVAPNKLAAPALSVFQQEQRMSFGQLMRRWNGEIAGAAKRFNVPEVWIRAVKRLAAPEIGRAHV